MIDNLQIITPQKTRNINLSRRQNYSLFYVKCVIHWTRQLATLCC